MTDMSEEHLKEALSVACDATREGHLQGPLVQTGESSLQSRRRAEAKIPTKPTRYSTNL